MLNQEFMTPEELSRFLRDRVTVKTLTQWRYLRRGPRFVKVGRSVLYPTDGVMEWLSENEINTMDAPRRRRNRHDQAATR